MCTKLKTGNVERIATFYLYVMLLKGKADKNEQILTNIEYKIKQIKQKLFSLSFEISY